MFEDKYVLPAALLEYYERIGAEVRNFRGGIVKSYHGDYYTERGIIKITADGEVRASNNEHAPTESEKNLIKAQWDQNNFPKHIHAEETGAKRQSERLMEERPEGVVHEFISRVTGKVVMLQQRYYEASGKRQFIPWTLWSDGVWRRMEPDNKLPLWKPVSSRKARIMVHEGSKSAMAAEEIALDPGSKHPWREYLSLFEHWGMIGGALAPQRTDWSELTREKPEEVIYVCDNDRPGTEALPKVSKMYGRKMNGIVFDERWEEGWDIADPMPEEFWYQGLYIGPEMQDMLKPATYATETIHGEGKGRPVTVVTSDFAGEWYHSVIPEAYVHRNWPNDIKTHEEFNNFIAPYSGVSDTATKLQKHDSSKGVRLIYTPELGSGIYNDFTGSGGLVLNTFMGSKVLPLEGDVSPFFEFMEHLIPNEIDRREMIRWIITLVSKPEVKMLYGALLISEQQGVGKGTLGEKILTPLVGKSNVSFPTESEIVDSSFNYWAAHKRLAVVHEIYAGHSSKAYNRLKSIITDGGIMVNKKYLAPYLVDNWLHVFACSNSMGALKLSQDDRRWFVPKLTGNKGTAKWWSELNHWLVKGGLRKIKHWSDQQSLDPEKVVMRGETAPMTEAKREVIQEGYSEAMRLAYRVLSHIKEEAYESGKVMVVLDTELIRLAKEVVYKDRYSQFMERPLTMRKVAQAAGFHVGDHKITCKEWGGIQAFQSRPLLAGREAEILVMGHSSTIMSRAEPFDLIKYANEKGLILF